MKNEDLTLELGSIKASIKRTQIADALKNAKAKDNYEANFAAADISLEEITDEAIAIYSSKRILWVDDNPMNNFYERAAFEALGIKCQIAYETDEAMKYLSEHTVDLIISDMGRGSNNNAGYELLEQVRFHKINVPFCIYASQDRPEFRKEALWYQQMIPTSYLNV